MAHSTQAQRFACKCLNIIISEQPRPDSDASTSKDWPNDSDYVHLYVGKEGIKIAHPQVTSRIRTRGVPIAGTSRCSRFTSLMCLICQMTVYRIYQTVPIDVEGKDGPLVPPEEWIEQGVMRSQTGWIDVHKDCLRNEAITRSESSTEFSKLFSLVVPPVTSEPLSSTLPMEHSPSGSTSTPPKHYLTGLRALFPPPPFSPSHPVFVHLSTLAKTRSDEIRASAEEAVAQFIREKEDAVRRVESVLTHEVEALWRRYTEANSNIQRERNASRVGARRAPSGGADVAPALGTPVSVREFVPVRVSMSRPSQSSSMPRISALSASLATSSFHHPRAQSERYVEDANPRALDARRSSHSSGSSRTLESSSSSSTLLTTKPPRLEGSSVLQFRPNNNDSLNTAVSFQYFVDLDEQMRQKRQRQLRAAEAQPSTGQVTTNGASAASAANNAPVAEPQAEASGSSRPTESRGREKRKARKVTFDVQPVEDSDRNGEIEEDSPEVIDLVFDLEDELGEHAVAKTQPTLEVLAPAPRNGRTRTVRAQPNPFTSLRPASLPAPSHIRPPRSSHQGVDSSSSQAAMLSPPPRTDKLRASTSQEPLTAREAEILKLVAADTPSHRGRWYKGSRAWNKLMSREDAKEDEDALDDLAEEQVESTPGERHFVGSLPIKPLVQQRKPLSLASYREEATLHERKASRDPNAPTIQEEDEQETEEQPSASSIRRANYAERDRLRDRDPGALDFGAEGDVAGLEAGPSQASQNGDVDEGVRGRAHALEILKARSEIPDSGMWRSMV
ncbi:hypothetical protein HGRIS_010167 [Hohenbuehelia grisea]|uniref:Uncharacterized protein n=1 Tax=Hohenbuehelia grisea TaxID=104357 RepID=A0ABR3J3G8_9AGAR